MYYPYLKRFADVIGAFTGIVLLSPLLLLIIIVIKIESPGPVFFKQKRVMKGKKHFSIYKFRTMKVETPSEVATHLLENPEGWITRSGRFLRKTSLDELPQLFNILFGHMSIIGPRPALWNQYDLLKERDKNNANSVPVGLTGLAQIRGRDDISIEEKAILDGNYASKITLWGDIKIFFGTVYSVIKRDGNREG